jgi:hypothetical protein
MLDADGSSRTISSLRRAGSSELARCVLLEGVVL